MSVSPDRASQSLGLRRAALLLVAVAVAASCAAGGGTPTPVPSLPGTPGHFDNGEFSFDYPTDWPVLAADQSIDLMTFHLVAVLGNGSWHENCTAGATDSYTWQECGFDTFDVPAGGVLDKIYWRGGGPAPMCLGSTQANATVGPNAVLKRTDGTMTSWEIRWPDGEFGWPNNPTFEVHTSDPAQLAKAEAMVASFRWGASAPSSGDMCVPTPPGSPAA